MLNVVFVLYDFMLSTSVSLPMEQLRAADAMARAKRNARPYKQLNIITASVSGDPVKTQSGLRLVPDCRLDEIVAADIVYLPAIWRNPRPVIEKNRAVIPWLKNCYSSGALIASVGTGGFLLAESGLLNHKPATTHWHYFDLFKKRYPLVQLKREYFITQADNLYCSGSVNALADLTVHFIQKFYSNTIASHVERHFFHEIRRAYDSAVAFQNANSAHPDEDILQIQLWLRDNLDKTASFASLAKKYDMSIRSLNRRFKTATGNTPLQYLQKIRMENAKDLLKTTNLSIGEVMDKVGYQDGAHFNQLFKKHHDTTPGQYRTTVRAKLFSPS